MTKYKIPVRTAEYVMIGSDYSQQEPKILSFVINDDAMTKAFSEGRDIYATIAGIAFNQPYEKCLEFHPETGEYQPEGKRMRGEAKTVVLGICYGRSTVTIGEQLFGTRDDMTDEDKTKAAQNIYDSVLNAFPNLRTGMMDAQNKARHYGYVETILGRRRHIPDMQLPEFEFKALSGYVNPDVDPLDIDTLQDRNEIPDRIIKQLTQEYANFKYNGQIYKKNNELYEQHIKVINNRKAITDASRQCLNCVDTETEILTTQGWKRYDEVHKGDIILSYSMETRKLEEDIVEDVHIYQRSKSDIDVVEFDSPVFSSVSTLEHKWPVYNEFKKVVEFRTTDEIDHQKLYYSILTSADTSKPDNPEFSDYFIRLVGVLLTTYDFVSEDCAEFDSYQHIRIAGAGIDWEIMFKGELLTEEFIFSLSQRQANILIGVMLNSDTSNNRNAYRCNSRRQAELFQILCVIGGYTSRMVINQSKETSDTSDASANATIYSVIVNTQRESKIHLFHAIHKKIDCVWCVTTKNHTWVARRNGCTYLTGNSVIQGSAAELTKMAILALYDNEEWNKLGGRLLVPVHDELICEIPIENWKRGGELLAQIMSDAGSFLPFSISCDVETTRGWYCLPFPCEYDKPIDLDYEKWTESNVKWVQYMLVEREYLLPLHPDENGDLRGIRARGIDGIFTSELIDDISDYCHRYGIPLDSFIDHIENLVIRGIKSKK